MERGVISSFQFVSYKVDHINLQFNHSPKILFSQEFNRDEWAFAVAVRQPICLQKEKIYICGVDMKMIYGDQNNPDVSIETGVIGAFKVIGDDISVELEEKIAKIQMPALLSPYLRAAITNILASSGIGSVVIPLFNFNALAEEQLKNIDIKRIISE